MQRKKSNSRTGTWSGRNFDHAVSLYILKYFCYDNIEEIPAGKDECMNGAEVMKHAMDEFKDIQEYMILADGENAVMTYARLKEKYLVLKTLLNSLGVNLTDIDKMKE